MVVRAMSLVLILVSGAFGQNAWTPLTPSNPAFPSYRPSPWGGTSAQRADTMRAFDSRNWYVPTQERVRVNQEQWRYGGRADSNAPMGYRPYGQTPMFNNDWHRKLEQRRINSWDLELQMKRTFQKPKPQKPYQAWPW